MEWADELFAILNTSRAVVVTGPAIRQELVPCGSSTEPFEVTEDAESTRGSSLDRTVSFLTGQTTMSRNH